MVALRYRELEGHRGANLDGYSSYPIGSLAVRPKNTFLSVYAQRNLCPTVWFNKRANRVMDRTSSVIAEETYTLRISSCLSVCWRDDTLSWQYHGTGRPFPQERSLRRYV